MLLNLLPELTYHLFKTRTTKNSFITISLVTRCFKIYIKITKLQIGPYLLPFYQSGDKNSRSAMKVWERSKDIADKNWAVKWNDLHIFFWQFDDEGDDTIWQIILAQITFLQSAVILINILCMHFPYKNLAPKILEPKCN